MREMCTVKIVYNVTDKCKKLVDNAELGSAKVH